MVKKKIMLVLVSVVLCLVGRAGFASDKTVQAADKEKVSQVKPQVQWARMYSHDDWSDREHSLIQSSDGGYYVTGQSSRKNRQGKYGYKLWIWKLDVNGNRRWAKTPDIPGIDESQGIGWDAVLSLKNERVILVDSYVRKTRAWLMIMKFNEGGEITFTKRLELDKTSHVLRNFERTKGGLLISGQKLGKFKDAWVLKIDDQGNELWQKNYDKGKTEDAMSVAVADDGSFILAANSGEYNKFGGGQSDIWIIKCDRQGNVISEATFEGRHPTIAITKDGICAVSFNKASFPKVDLQIMGLDEKLNKIWGPQALYEGQGVGIYNIKTDSADNFIIAGSKFMEVGLWKYNRKGNEIWSIPVRTQMSVPLIHLLITTENEYILAGAGVDLALALENYDPNQKKPGPNEHRDNMDIFITKVVEVGKN
ncbi:MAG: hypothetical protein ACYS32_19095 [Planctomycetota bacterium]|jgi:hypothetical protein